MSTITFDTLKFADRLEKAGASRELAAAIVDAQKDALSESLETSLATKGDIVDVKNELKLGLSDVRHELGLLRWMMGILIAITITNFAKQFF